MPQVSPSYSNEIVLRKRDLGTIVFDGARFGVARVGGLLWIRDHDVIQMLDREPEEAGALFDRLSPGDRLTAVLDCLEHGPELGGFVSPIGAMKMALACPDVATPGSAAGRFLRWFGADAARSAAAAAVRPARCYGHLGVFEGGRA